MKQLQTIASFVQPHEAYVCAGVLRENGIDSFIKNELTTQTLSMISDQLGGVQLQVDLENVERATQILLENELIENPTAQSTGEDFLFAEYTLKIPLINKLPIQFQFVASFMFLIVIILFSLAVYGSSKH